MSVKPGRPSNWKAGKRAAYFADNYMNGCTFGPRKKGRGGRAAMLGSSVPVALAMCF